MTTRFAICTHCNKIRSLADMSNGKCKFCPGEPQPRPSLAPPALPPGFMVHPAIRPENDAISDVLRRIGER